MWCGVRFQSLVSLSCLRRAEALSVVVPAKVAMAMGIANARAGRRRLPLGLQRALSSPGKNLAPRKAISWSAPSAPVMVSLGCCMLLEG
ncbi:hypothetical protein PF005_g22489 [Phytophthora fragariae]|uniref:Secreted protein n=1 Tax=Phytophthora fragariae TaxID=53985 RepID=A0A6A3QWV1_9STRA|nr:hypothetical protein PF003_g15787 [Phytophthora fragariae]KAE8926295.1 hypothetical protein PF009_g23514 [Phytophthora fragariae]KAE8983424.1 hypothetical protein PF011_g21194 [Phytophthora fragariae]KAE9082057.1 hypothetical protein PF010_g21750 [Phytophthora fragariae]KAE9083180.1 hypothetical protein PF007_g22004 [Phytophthora fragariae]